ncbi:MAG: galactose-1-phosphate uridylyltransferase [Omnitrophica WOR_2 bacterium SM23_29]|nr:MAG: galactose-1-phosphate uridylyltransferase [Omnitrophica WOR_2 bacterium SM23_29]
MAELRRDPITGRWVIIETDKIKNSSDYHVEQRPKKGGVCPFCPGNEHMTPPEIEAHREGEVKPNAPGWHTRVIPNKFPALRVEGNIDRVGVGMYDIMNGIGAHEVIVENPDHNKELCDATDLDVERVIWAYRNRSLDLRRDKRFKYILIFKNYGITAGATLEHPHSQLIALPIVPKRVKEELHWSEQYYGYRERCVFCDIIHQEMDERIRIITENKSFIAFAPFVSRFPFEISIFPKMHNADFSYIHKEEIFDLARILREALLRIKTALKDPSYNYIIHTSPIETRERVDYHWHIEIMPKLGKIAGFEWGTGFYINQTPPEIAAEALRKVPV